MAAACVGRCTRFHEKTALFEISLWLVCLDLFRFLPWRAIKLPCIFAFLMSSPLRVIPSVLQAECGVSGRKIEKGKRRQVWKSNPSGYN